MDAGLDHPVTVLLPPPPSGAGHAAPA
jgi:hypothetical protein